MPVQSFRQAVVERKIELANYVITRLGRSIAQPRSSHRDTARPAATCRRQKPIWRSCVAELQPFEEPQRPMVPTTPARKLSTALLGALRPRPRGAPRADRASGAGSR